MTDGLEEFVTSPIANMAAAMATAKTCFYVNASQDGIVPPLTHNAICHIAQWVIPCVKPAIFSIQ